MMRLLRDCLSCCLTWVVLSLILLGLAIYLGLPLITSAVEQLALQGNIP